MPHPDLHEALGLSLAAHNRIAEAAVCFRASVICRPDRAESYNNLALAAGRLGRTADAVRSFRHALRLHPLFAEAHNNLGMISPEGGGYYRRAIVACPAMPEANANLAFHLVARGDAERARRAVIRALILRPDVAATHYALGTVLSEGAVSGALAAARAALACQPDFGPAHNLRGMLALRQGALIPAGEAYRRALVCAPDPVYFNNLAAVHRFRRGDADLAAMENLAHRAPPRDEGGRVALHFALAKAYDDCDDVALAFRHLSEANARKRRMIDYDEQAALSFMERVRSVFDRERIERLRGMGDPADTPIFILGMPRSGSTLIEQILASHSRVHGGDERADFPEILEQFGFPDAADDLAGVDWRRLGAAYMERTRRLAPAERVTDKLPNNFLHAGIIHLALPNARIVHSRRGAAATCFSCFTKLFQDGNQLFTYELGELGRYWRAYARLMEHWRSVLPPGVLIEVDYETLVAQPETETRRILYHCGLEWDPACLTFHETRRAVKTASAAEVRQKLHDRAVGRWRRYRPWIGPLLEALEAV